MRLTAACFIFLTIIIACERKEAPTPEAIEIAQAPVSDELPGLPAPATGISFWDHPTLSFNSTMIVATEAGVVAYSMEDGVEVSRIDGFKAEGVATGYIGEGAQAAGFIAFLDTQAGAFHFYGVDNNTRAFLPIDGGPAVRGAVRGFCIGRGLGAATPSLFVVQNAKVQIFNLAGAQGGVAIESETTIDTPDNLKSCAVDLDGRVIVAADNGDLYRLSGQNAFAAPFAHADIETAGDIAVIAAANPEDPSDITGEILFPDLAKGVIFVFDRNDGVLKGLVKLTATDDLPGADKGDVFAATGGNLGGLYRNGVVAFGVGDETNGPVIRIAPGSSIKNALSIPVGDPVSPRGQAPAPEDDGLIIPIKLDQ